MRGIAKYSDQRICYFIQSLRAFHQALPQYLFQMRPRFTQDGPEMGPRWPKVSPRWLTMARDGPQMAQDAPKMAPRWTKMAQDGPKMAPRWPKLAPRWLQDGPSWPQDDPEMAHDGPSWPQDGPKLAQDGPRWAQEGPKRSPRVVPKGSHIGLTRPSNIEAEKGRPRVNLIFRFLPFRCRGVAILGST